MSMGMIFGAQYFRPPFPTRDCWQRDFQAMQANGFNTVKLWAVWNWIEKVEGVYDFDELDELVGLADRYGLKVILNLIPEGAPYWALQTNQDALYKTARGETVTFGGPANLPSAGWPGFCWDSPQAQLLMEKFIEATAAHFRYDKSVIAIDVWNEPHLEPMFDYRQELLCYCDHSCAAFRTWLQQKYGDLEALNTAWFRQYLCWDEVTPPPRFGTWTDMLDWRLFWIGNLRRWLRLRVQAARRGAPEKIMQTHVAYSGVLGNMMKGGLCNELGDEFALAHEVDVFGLSSFPKWLMGPDHMYTHLAHNEMVAEASRGKPFYQVELQGGGGKAGLFGGEVPTASDIMVWNYNTIVAGGKGVLYWQYAPEPAGTESPGFGLTGFSGQATPRSTAAGICAKTLNTEAIAECTRVPAVNAIYISRYSQALCFSANREEHLYAGSVDGVYKAAYHAGIPVRFFHEDTIDALLDENIAVLYLPMTIVLSQKEIDALGAFVRAGGTLIGEACTGLYRMDGQLDLNCKALKALFGLEHVEVQALKGWGSIPIALDSDKGAFLGSHYRQVTQPHADTHVLASFDDGVPAITSCTMGAGTAVFIATCASLSYHTQQDAGTREVLIGKFHRSGYPHIDSICCNGSQAVVRLHETEESYLVAAVNHQTEPSEVCVEFTSGFTVQKTLRFTVAGLTGAMQTILKKK